MRIDVESYCGFKDDQRPLRFRLGGDWLDVTEVVDQWCGPDTLWFRVLASDGNVYLVKRREKEGVWTLESSRPTSP
jgi:hypothetical protein